MKKDWVNLDLDLVKLLGGYDEAVVFSFISDNISNSDNLVDNGYVPITYQTFLEKRFLTEYKVRRIVNNMKKNKFVDTKVKKVDGNPVLHYKIM